MITRELVARYLAWVMVAACLVLIGTMLVAGAWRTSYDDLRSAVRDGHVDEVRVAGGLADGQANGYAYAEVHWRRYLIPRVSRVVESTRAHPNRGIQYSTEVPRIHGRVDENLRALDPDLHVTRSGELGSGELGFTIGGPGPERGWQIPAWTVALGLAMFVCTVWLLIMGPEPRRATRWAWFWLCGVAVPLGILAFLFLGGVAAIRRRPVQTAGRLTGGWAFLLALVLNSALATLGPTLV